MRNRLQKVICASLTAGLLWAAVAVSAAEVKILNVSYDVTREFYQDYNKAFEAYWKAKTGDTVTVSQSHDGSEQAGTICFQRTRSRCGNDEPAAGH